jgi:uncharacterized protein (TIGR00369 family)
MTRLERSDWCFACGKANEFGLRLKVDTHEGKAHTEFVPLKRHEGYNGVMHGGIMATLLDEVLAWASISLGINAITASINVRFKLPAKIGERIDVDGEVKRTRGKLLSGNATARNSRGETLATAEAKLMSF